MTYKVSSGTLNLYLLLTTLRCASQAEEKGRKSKERLEEEKRAILKQRIRPLDIEDADAARLAEKAKELHLLVTRLEGEKYDLEKNYKSRQMEVSWLRIAVVWADLLRASIRLCIPTI